MATPFNDTQSYSAGEVGMHTPQVAEVNSDGSAPSENNSGRKIKRKSFGLRALTFVVTIVALFVLLRLFEPAFSRGTLLRPFHTALVVCALVSFALFVWHAMLPRMRDIGLSGSPLWVILVLILVLPVTTVACLALAIAPSNSLPSELRQRSAENEGNCVPHFNQRFTRLWSGYHWLISFLVISPGVFLIPNDLFARYPWAKAYTDWLTQWIPMIGRAAHLHPHPDKFQAFFAYAWSWLPVILILGVSARTPYFDGLKKMWGTQPLGTFLYSVVCAWGLWLMIYAPGNLFFDPRVMPRSDQRSLFYSSDFALLWSGPLQVFAAVNVVLTLWCVGNIVRTEVYAIKTPGQEG